MSTEGLSEQHYKAILADERRLFVTLPLFSKPKIETTACKAAKFRSDIIVPEGATNKTFSDDGAFGTVFLPLGILVMAFMIWMIFSNGETLQLWVKIVISLVLCVVAIGGGTQMMKPDPSLQIQMDTRSIRIERYSFSWDDIQATFIIRSAGRNGHGPEMLGLLLKNGHVRRFELIHYGATVEICKYIEHFKGQRRQS
ncbi:hypothetical protein SAMN05428949_5444 [Chitinophaga sp. YR627]|uniref:hypothetical protein n=1 Tax=Chitinophaga sp. YR627 TaxID=1881041 RepID=UPI0008E67872|nr:hypothetical protein [Chitinophaga sp. YR627]SFO50100.1 hypothetical protein SAMN05428949_5444 [Chitinophaga sp. YR627]